MWPGKAKRFVPTGPSSDLPDPPRIPAHDGVGKSDGGAEGTAGLKHIQCLAQVEQGPGPGSQGA